MWQAGFAPLQPKPVKAYAWFRLAAERGVETAAAKLAELGARMTAEEVAEAESIVEVWYRYIVPRG
jgi:TPR repeat protein